ncbi:MAG: tlde1 domain-containing protein [Pseudomonadota bacterium]
MTQDRYASERGSPEVPTCGVSPLTLHFDGKWLELRIGGYRAAYGAVSGKPLASGGFDYSVERQKLKNVGPIPEGRYWIKPSDLWTNAWYRRGRYSAWGNYRVTLRVFPGTETHGRGGFFIHGGTVRGSAGCIDLTSAMDSFVENMNKHKGRGDCYISVTVDY